MQIVRREPLTIQPLTCGACRHWQETSTPQVDGDRAGRCARFRETRAAGMRPLCNICWEPQEPTGNQQPVEAEVQ